MVFKKTVRQHENKNFGIDYLKAWKLFKLLKFKNWVRFRFLGGGNLRANLNTFGQKLEEKKLSRFINHLSTLIGPFLLGS